MYAQAPIVGGRLLATAEAGRIGALRGDNRFAGPRIELSRLELSLELRPRMLFSRNYFRKSFDAGVKIRILAADLIRAALRAASSILRKPLSRLQEGCELRMKYLQKMSAKRPETPVATSPLMPILKANRRIP